MSKNNNNTSKGTIIASICIIIWFFGSIGYMLYASESGGEYATAKMMIAFGQVFAVVGLGAIIGGIKSKQLMAGAVGFVFFAVGAGIIMSGVATITHNDALHDVFMAIVSYLFVGVYALISIGLVAHSCYKFYVTKSKYTDKVNVECIHVHSHLSKSENGSHMVYSPVWKGWYHGEYTIFSCNHFVSRKYVIGQSETISVNPDDKTEYMDSVQSFSYKVSLFIGGVFLVCGCAIAYILLFQH